MGTESSASSSRVSQGLRDPGAGGTLSINRKCRIRLCGGACWTFQRCLEAWLVKGAACVWPDVCTVAQQCVGVCVPESCLQGCLVFPIQPFCTLAIALVSFSG